MHVAPVLPVYSVPVSELGCANAGVSWDLLALARRKVELAGRVSLFLLCHEGCRGIKDWVLLVAWAYPDTGRNWGFGVLSKCRHGSSPANFSSCNWVYLPGLSFQELTRCECYLQASFQTCAFSKVNLSAKLLQSAGL